MPIPLVVTIEDSESIAVPPEMEEEAQKMANHIIKTIDKAIDSWDGPGGPDAFGQQTIGNIVALARNHFDRWMAITETAKIETGEGKSPIKTAGTNPVPFLAKRVYEVIKAHVGQAYTEQGKGGFNAQDIPSIRTLVTIALQIVLTKYKAAEGILNTDVSHW